MGAKRALIVDDSKSARLFLARALEKYEIDVDSAESAEAAIEYLGSNRPDVIFMDHLMPGMDGLQAVRAIKNNPRTATIPIMMYTSQEGELYLGQARALGAMGVLPKQIKPTDVSKVLYQLHLVPDRRNAEQRSFTPLTPPGGAAEPVRGAPAAVPGSFSKALTESALREHFAELRRALVAGVDTQTERITAELRALVLELTPPAPRTAARRVGAPWAWIVACAALALALASTLLWWRNTRLLEALAAPPTQLRAPAASGAALPAGPDALRAASRALPPVAAAAPEPKPIVITLPYGVDPLSGARLETIRQLLARLTRQKAAGLVDIRTFAGRFCLVGNALDGYSLPPEEMPFARCDVVGNPADEGMSPVQRTPLALANLIAATRSATNGALEVQVAVGDPGNVLVPYPQVAGDLTAGDWNHAGSANNRIEIRVR